MRVRVVLCKWQELVILHFVTLMRRSVSFKLRIMIGVYDVYIGSAWKPAKSGDPNRGAYYFLVNGNSLGRGHKADEYIGHGFIVTGNINLPIFLGITKACEHIPANATKVTFHCSNSLAYETFSKSIKAKKWRKPFFTEFNEKTNGYKTLFKLHSSDSACMAVCMQKAAMLLGVNKDHSKKAKKAPSPNIRPKEESPVDYYLYTDGSCNNLTEPHEGGYAYALLDSKMNVVKQGSCGELHTTNNKMEMKAIIEGCKAIDNRKAHVIVRSDSTYCINILSGRWKGKANTHLIAAHKKENATLHIEYEWVMGHAGDKYNELCDTLSREAAEKARKEASEPSQQIHTKIEKPSCKKSTSYVSNKAFQYVVYATSLWERNIAGCAFTIYDNNDELVTKGTFCYGNDTYKAVLKCIIKAVHEVPECNVNILVCSDSEYAINILNGSWTPKKNFSLINEQIKNEKNWGISYNLLKSNNPFIKEVRLLANQAISNELEHNAEDKDSYKVSFKAFVDNTDIAKCCLVIRLLDGSLHTEVFNRPFDFKHLDDSLEYLVEEIIVMALTIIPEEATVDIYSEHCFPFLSRLIRITDENVSEISNKKVAQLLYTKDGERRHIRVFKERISRLDHAIERMMLNAE